MRDGFSFNDREKEADQLLQHGTTQTRWNSERMVVRSPNRRVEMVNICRTVQKKIRQVRQFVNRTGGGVVEGDDEKRERVCVEEKEKQVGEKK